MESNEPQKLGVPKQGDRFGRYLLVREIGQGGMAVVFEAIQQDLQKRVALKILHPWFSLRQDVVQRFVIEARAASRLAHPHVVAVHDIGVHQNMPFLAMDLLEGQDLESLVEKQPGLSLERIVDIFLPILSALATAHEAGILHRDIKPENIFIARRPPREHPVLLDFGISKFDTNAPVQSLTAAGEIVGTPAFIAPEVATGGMDRFTPRSDQYAIAVTLYLVTTGKLPYDGDNLATMLGAIVHGGCKPPSAHRPALPAAFDSLVLKAMALAPEERFASIRALGHALLPFASNVGRSLWSADFHTYGADRSTMQFVPFRPGDLRSVEALRDVADIEIERAVALGKLQTVHRGASICVQGSRAESCYLLVSGEVEVAKTHGADTHDMGRLKSGSIMGLSALWEDSTRPVSIVAATECTLVEISRNTFNTLTTACPSFADALLYEAITLASDRVSKANQKSKNPLAADPDKQLETLIRLSASIREWSIPMSKEP